MKIKEAIKDTNKALLGFLRHDHWELKLGFNQIKQGAREIFGGIKHISRWLIAVLAIPFIPFLYPIAVVIRIFKK